MPSNADHRRVEWRFPDAPPGTCRGCGKPVFPSDRRTHPACRDQHREQYDHRGALERDGRLFCVDANRPDLGPCRGKVQSDHVVPLGHNGPHDWTVGRCEHHHQLKTNADRAKYGPTRRSPARMSATTNVEETTGRSPVRVALGVGLLGAAGSVLLHRTSLAVTFVVVAVVFAVFRSWKTHQDAVRVEAGARLSFALAKETRTVPDDMTVTIRRWRKGHPVAGAARYAATFDDRDGSVPRQAVEELLEHKVGWTGRPGGTGEPLVFTWEPHRDTVHWRLPRNGEDVAGRREWEAPDVEPDAVGVRALIQDALNERWKTDAVQVSADVAGDEPQAFTVRYPSKVRDHTDDVRFEALSTVMAKAGGRWLAEWDTRTNTATFTRRAEMPERVPFPVDGYDDPRRFPIGVDASGKVVYWDLDAHPHALVGGSTGGGKTIFLAALALRALLWGYDVVVVDGKGTALAAFRGRPGVIRTGLGDPQPMHDALLDTEEDMNERYRQVRDEDANPATFRPTLILLDEAAEAMSVISRWWPKVRKASAGDPKDAPSLDAWYSIARKGREGKVHLVVGIQQAAAGFFGGTESRDQLTARIALGRTTEQSARMLFGSSDIGRDLPAKAKGRATVFLGDTYEEVQTWYLPKLLPNGHAEDPAEDGVWQDLWARLDTRKAPEPKAAPQQLTLTKRDDEDDDQQAPAPRKPQRWTPRHPGQLTADDVAREAKLRIDGALCELEDVQEHRDGVELTYWQGGERRCVVFSESDTVEVLE